MLDLSAAADLGLLDNGVSATVRACTDVGLNPLMAAEHSKSTALRQRLSELLSVGHRAVDSRDRLLVAQHQAVFYLPAAIGGFTDFYTSLFHSERTGTCISSRQPRTSQFPLHADRLQQPRQFGSDQWRGNQTSTRPAAPG